MASWTTEKPVFIVQVFWIVIIIFIVVVGTYATLAPVILFGPQQHVQVEVVEKKTGSPSNSESKDRLSDYYITFRFSDGSEHELSVNKKDYNSIQENDTGSLVYQERRDNDKTKQFRIRFVRFEKDS